jgi:hypothetical protein
MPGLILGGFVAIWVVALVRVVGARRVRRGASVVSLASRGRRRRRAA